jgi:hypothetical protein
MQSNIRVEQQEVGRTTHFEGAWGKSSQEEGYFHQRGTLNSRVMLPQCNLNFLFKVLYYE